jgi:branched-chain amino acid aminotransferase
MHPRSEFIWIDGKLTPYDQAVVPFLSSTIHYGAGAFEGIRCYKTENGPAVFRLKEHIERLFDSAKILGIREMPFSEEQVCQAVKDTINANGYEECYIRPLVYFSDNAMNLNIDNGVVSIGVAVWKWGAYLGEEGLMKGVRACVSSYTRSHINANMTKAKITGNYPNSILAKTEATRNGFEEAIMLDTQGYVAECTGENLFLVRRGKIITPPQAPVLEGITRDALCQIAEYMGLQVVEAQISRDQLYIADEIFVCGTAAEVCAIREVDYRTIGEGKMGPVTRQIQRAYADAVHGMHPLSASWLDYVSQPSAGALSESSISISTPAD